MSKFISEWRYGAFNLLAILLIAIAGPVVVMGLICAAIILPMVLFGISTDFFDKHIYGITLAAIIILGPYFLGKDWDKVEEFAKGTKPSSQKAKLKSQDELSSNINPNYDDRGRKLNNAEKWLAVGFAIFCILALIFF